jgi:hypothetical protein
VSQGDCGHGDLGEARIDEVAPGEGGPGHGDLGEARVSQGDCGHGDLGEARIDEVAPGEGDPTQGNSTQGVSPEDDSPQGGPASTDNPTTGSTNATTQDTAPTQQTTTDQPHRDLASSPEGGPVQGNSPQGGPTPTAATAPTAAITNALTKDTTDSDSPQANSPVGNQDNELGSGVEKRTAPEFHEVLITDENGRFLIDPDVPFVIGDSAYGGLENRRELAKVGIGILSRIPVPHNKKGRFTKDEFQIDTLNATVSCPNQKVVPYKKRQSGESTASFGQSCSDCPLKERCTSSKNGRTIRIHPHQDEMDRLRVQQKDQTFKSLYNHYRSFAERMNSQLVAVLHGGRKSRYIGLAKSQLCVSQRAASVNLLQISKLLVGILKKKG